MPTMTSIAMPAPKASIVIVELSRDFMPSSNPILLNRSSFPFRSISNCRARINFQYTVQIQNQRKAIVMPQHADAVRHALRWAIQNVFRSHRICADHFVCRDSQPQDVVLSLQVKRRHHNVLRQKSWPAPFRHRDVNQRHNRPSQIENAYDIGWRKRQPCRVWPFKHFFHVQHGQAKPFASASKHAVLRFRCSILQRPKRFEQLGRIGIGRKWCELELFVIHRISQAKRLTARNSSSRVNGFVTYPSAPCCSPQYLSLAESLLVTRITGIVLNSLLLFSSRQT